ncbi:NRAMP (natural resistance-associated macrophage protein) metal ion transporter family protein (macronuclear) [Tetrahymena thermophila SB210]|uniref:NRAMP (Natural resistance-associated macrophage protein) metal ion transporter family protein n=1 Tax=Tetrahymena thermophila (strain SB210) TaxID=312017 RepID=Q24C68_TETTS|nr:NRAMP (natural resistance-associated macrophage protein) metal ion transporter family protein [Tetrahymena thermophila SB210]EAS05370.1 NRAMP (natural resistance-associated macrophage protein) metal ion transporter family protein [Tetrahymena thermophila SB210]|eukprot:XP_001025615.1 NRAMP (natural resistance-associated macrophage protein) metal ion transporter family protein [Tetrahymena thermophila SB210]
MIDSAQTDTNLQSATSEYEKINIKFSFRECLSYFGPGLLVSIAYLDPGNLAGDMDAGLNGKYHLLWVLFLATALGFVFQNRAMMIGLVSGKDMAKLCRYYYPRKMSILLWIMAEIAIIGSDIQEVLGSAIALQILFGLKLWIGVLLTITTTVLILLVKYIGMRALEVFFAILIGTMAICFFIELGFIGPNFGQLMEGMFVPYVPSSAFSSMIGLIGAVLMPHNLYLHSSLVYEKKISKNDRPLLHKSIMYFKIETGVSLLISFFINLAVIGTFANWYNTNEDLDLHSAASVLEVNFGTSAKYIWGIGLLAAGQSSTLTGTLAGQFVMTGFVKLRVSKFKRAFVTRCIAIAPSIIIAFISENENFNNYLNVLQAVQLPFAVIPLLKLSIDRDLMGEFTMGKVQLIILSILSSAIVVVNYYSQIPSDVDWSSAWIYIIIAVMILYFIFLGFVLFTKIKKTKDVKLSMASHAQKQSLIQDDEQQNYA